MLRTTAAECRTSAGAVLACALIALCSTHALASDDGDGWTTGHPDSEIVNPDEIPYPDAKPRAHDEIDFPDAKPRAHDELDFPDAKPRAHDEIPFPDAKPRNPDQIPYP